MRAGLISLRYPFRNIQRTSSEEINLHHLWKVGQAEKQPVGLSPCLGDELHHLLLETPGKPCTPDAPVHHQPFPVLPENTNKSTFHSVRRAWPINRLLNFWHKSFLSGGPLRTSPDIQPAKGHSFTMLILG